jgi:hypothetical protein
MASRTFLALQNEGYLMGGCLRTALVLLKKSSPGNKAQLYAALFNYSIGLERLFKLVVLFEHCLAHDGAFPNFQVLKSAGHNLNDLYKMGLGIASQRQIDCPASCRGDEIDGRIISLLSGFAVSGRYFNLDRLTGGTGSADPLPELAALLSAIYERDVPAMTRAKSENEADAIACLVKPGFIDVGVTGLAGEEQFREDFYQNGRKYMLAQRELLWRLARLLVPYSLLIEQQVTLLHANEKDEEDDFPMMDEFLDFICGDRKATLSDLKRM